VFWWYLTFWHIVYLGMLALLWGSALIDAWPALGWRQLALTGLIAAQAALYVRSFLFNRRWPLPGWHLALYFVGSVALWYLEWRLDERFFWLIMSYFGQSFGILPPVAAIPTASAIYVFINGQANGWSLAGWTSVELLGVGMGWVSFVVVYWFFHTVMRTSQERAGLIHDLQAAQRELEQAHARETELATLRERERLARDLHDSLGHALVAISIQLEAIQRLYRVDAEKAAAQVEALKALTRSSMDELRRSLEGLRALGLGDQPLGEALQALAVSAGQRTGLAVACHVAGPAEQLAPAAAEALWRVAQEALTNVEKHAAARHVELRLDVQPAFTALSVSDDGRGFPPGANETGHYGLRGMRERIEGLGGTLTLDGDRGASVEARLPR
jgi:signal transduction histidine kinase